MVLSLDISALALKAVNWLKSSAKVISCCCPESHWLNLFTAAYCCSAALQHLKVLLLSTMGRNIMGVTIIFIELWVMERVHVFGEDLDQTLCITNTVYMYNKLIST